MASRGATLAIVLVVAALTAQSAPPAKTIAGRQFDYVAQKGDTWQSLGARFGIEAIALAADNGRRTTDALPIGSSVHVDTRHLVPESLETGVVINLPQRMLFVMMDGQVDATYPIGLGRPDWPTFEGTFRITAMEIDPVWDVPESIQEEQRRAGKKVLTRVAPGPNNPLGKYWLGLSAASYGIHGTNAPLSIYRFQSHGCVRLHPEDIADLWQRVFVGMPGETVYQPVLLRATDTGILLEVHPDIYRRQVGDDEAWLRDESTRRGLTDRLDWAIVRQILRARDGRPRHVGIDERFAR